MNNITYDESQIRRDVDTAKVVELLKKWRNEKITKGGFMDILNYDDEIICPVCNAIGRIKKRDRRVSDLTMQEFKSLMVECFEMLKQREIDTSVKEYKRLTIDDISTRNGVPVPKEF